MEQSYLYTRRFLDSQIRLLQTPLQGTADVRAACDACGVSSKQLLALLSKLNVLLKRHNKTVFLQQIVAQIVQQVLKAERSKLEMIHERLERIQLLVRPVLVPSEHGTLLQELDQLVTELPEAKYLFVGGEGPGAGESASEDDVSAAGSDENDILINDDHERVQEPHKNTLRARIRYQAQKEQAGDEVLAEYEGIRLQLVQLNQTLQLKSQKLQYLESVRDKLAAALGLEHTQAPPSAHSNRHVSNEMDKFRILVDSIKFKAPKESSVADLLLQKMPN